MSGSNNEIVYEGWLTKSPPSKRIWKARWRRRWFVLRHSGELPGQFFLQYYTDRNCRKLKGTIDLDQCEQVDAGLRFENSKQNYPHMFDVKTPKRTYYLAADSETDMNKWVDCVCQVCGLKSATDDTSVEFTEENNDSILATNDAGETESPSLSPASTVSGPYIPISECISGKPLNTPVGILDFNNIISRQTVPGSTNKIIKDSYQAQSVRQNKLNTIKQTVCDDDISKCDSNKSVTLVMSMPKPSVDRLNSLYGANKNILTNSGAKPEDGINNTKITNIESAKKMAELRSQASRPPDLKLSESMPLDFYDSPRKIVMDKSEWSPGDWPRQPVAPIPNWETFPNTETHEEAFFSPGDIGSWSVVQRFGKLTVVDSKLPIVTNSLNRATKQKAQPDTSSLRRPVAPPRPPKPSHLVTQENSHCYLNLDKPNGEAGETVKNLSSPNSVTSQQENASIDEMYDIPRSHQPQSEDLTPGGRQANRHNYLNAAPSETGNVFVYDFSEIQSNNIHDEVNSLEPTSPRSEGSGSGLIYSNLPSPLKGGISTPPAVNRELKPSRKMSDSGVSNEPSPGGPFTSSLAKEPSPGGPFTLAPPGDPTVNGPPSIDRTLKPKKLQSEGALKLGKPPRSSLSLRRVRAGPSPVPLQGSSTLPSNMCNGRVRPEYSSSEEDPRRSPDNEPIYYYESTNNRYIPAGKKISEIQYIDLDLESDANSMSTNSTQPTGPTTTVYKTVDFLKTEAFNRTRQEVEEERNKLPAE
ncbi:hypothetical protein RUM44_008129 [Polyplax serrata]|uniref:PH domain-containing protein n=1 Tax=Polyplax serrata TaxID=468196 RepID=A0ABR1B7T2_POLSC